MAANTDPIYSRLSDIQAVLCLNTGGSFAANAVSDGTGTITSVFQADTTNGGFVQRIRVQPAATSGTASTTATTIRIFLATSAVTLSGANFSGNTSSNTWSIAELTLPATTLSLTAGQASYDIPLNIALPPGYRLGCAFASALTVNTGYVVMTIAGKY